VFKLVIVVEDDIDPDDWMAVERSLAARFRGHERPGSNVRITLRHSRLRALEPKGHESG
jgi:UbiD family decarboxylase